MKIYDPYIRSRTQPDEVLKNLAYFGTQEVVTVAHGGQGFEKASQLIGYLEQLTEGEVRRLERCGIRGHVALGVPPDARPRRTHYEVWEELPKLLERDVVVAVGEIGVWEDTRSQWQLFLRQVEMAVERELAILLVPPVELKITLTYKMMARLEKAGVAPERVLVHRMDEKMVENVIESGFCAGYPVGAATNEPRQAARFLADLLEKSGPAERVLLTSGLRTASADVLGVPKTIVALQELGVAASVIEGWVCENARRLFDAKGRYEEEESHE